MIATAAKLKMLAKLPEADLREAILALAAEQEADERRRQGQRERTARYNAKITLKKRENNVNLTSESRCIVVKKESKKDSSSKVLLPDDFKPSEKHFERAAGMGQSASYVWDRIDDMRLWSISKGERRTLRGWDATLHTFMKRDNKLSKKSLTHHQSIQKINKERLDNVLKFALSSDQDHQPEICGQLGSPDNQAIPPDRRDNRTIHSDLGQPSLRLSREHAGQGAGPQGSHCETPVFAGFEYLQKASG